LNRFFSPFSRYTASSFLSLDASFTLSISGRREATLARLGDCWSERLRPYSPSNLHHLGPMHVSYPLPLVVPSSSR
ncbi:hypothetical protein PENTCL1PPCAC_9155, partial [Pristionchus entomophagus]